MNCCYAEFGGVDCPAIPGTVQPLSRSTGDVESFSGKYRGIQGHHNSCYLDATLFSMFAFTRWVSHELVVSYWWPYDLQYLLIALRCQTQNHFTNSNVASILVDGDPSELKPPLIYRTLHNTFNWFLWAVSKPQSSIMSFKQKAFRS